VIVRRVAVDPVRSGRLRDVGWPPGLRAVVAGALAVYLAGVVVVLFARPLRATSGTLTVVDAYTVGLPRGLVAVLVLLVVVALALFVTAALHGPWWLRVLALLTAEALLGVWGLRPVGRLFSPVPVGLSAVAMVGLLVVVLVRARRPYAWGEFCAVLGLLGLGIGAALVGLSNGALTLGFDLAPSYLLQTVQLLTVIATPAALAAGVSVAEITLTATLALTAGVRRYARGRAVRVVLAVVVLVRLGQLGWLASRADPVRVGPASWLTSGAVVLALGVVAAAVLRRRPRAGEREQVEAAELPERVTRIGLPLGAGLIVLLVPTLVAVVGLQLLLALDPAGPLGRLDLDPVLLLTSGTTNGVFRLVLAVATAVLAAVLLGRGHRATALLLGTTAVMLVALTPRLLTGGRVATEVNPDLINAYATAGVLVAVGVALVRRRLDGERATAYATALLISALFSARDFVTDPLGTVIGVSGVALVLFGVSWDLLTGSEWANRGSRRFPVPTRVLLLLANAVLVVAILAVTALGRDPNPGFALDPYASLGDFVLGTALLASAYAAVLSPSSVRRPPGP
jgi:hypothetical protein